MVMRGEVRPEPALRGKQTHRGAGEHRKPRRQPRSWPARTARPAELHVSHIIFRGAHYISLTPVFSNSDDVLERFHNPNFRQAMADRSYEYVLDQHTYAHRLSSIRKLLD